MIIEATTQRLSEIYGRLATVVPTRHNIPAYQRILVQAALGNVSLTASDTETTLQYVANPEEDASEARMIRPGDCLLPAREFGQILRTSRSKRLTISVDEKSIEVRATDGSWEFPLADAKDFKLPEAQQNRTCSVQAGLFRHLIQSTLYATPTDGVGKYALAGVCMAIEERMLRLVATDSKILAAAAAPHLSAEPAESTPIWPKKAIVAAENLFREKPRKIEDLDQPTESAEKGDEESAEPIHGEMAKGADAVQESDEVRLSWNLNEARLHFKYWRLHTRLLEGRFPPWRQVVPRQSTRIISFKAGPMRDAIKRAMIGCDAETVKLLFTITKNECWLEGESKTNGRATCSVPIISDKPDAESIKVAMDYRYLLKYLATRDPHDELKWEYLKSQSSQVFRCSNTPDDLFLIVPLV